MTMDVSRWQQINFDAKDSSSTMLHYLDSGLKFGGIAILFMS